jgi:tetratricopeptide (TPR) repeat protein
MVQKMTKISSPQVKTLSVSMSLVAAFMFSASAARQAAATQPVGIQLLAQTTTTDAPIPVSPFQYIPTPRWKEPDPAETINRTPAQQKILDLYKASNYAEVASEGLALLTKEKIDDNLQLMIANSMAWSGRTKEAGQLYRVLLDSKYKSEALVGLASLYRWQGKDHLALPLYKEILALEPNNKDALEGLRLANRELKPRTTITLGGLQDSSKVDIQSIKTSHRWTEENLANVWEIEAGALHSKDPTVMVKRSSLTVRYKMQEAFLKPRFELGSDGKNMFGNVGIALSEIPVLIDVGRVNWGEISNNPKGLAANLTATRVSAQLNTTFDTGSLFARAEFNQISDGNTVSTTAIRFTPAWRPFGAHFKPLLGIETRDAKENKAQYWSPANGYGTAFAGVLAEWQEIDWNFFTSAQAGTRLFGEAGTSWSLSSGGKLWLNKEWAVGLRFWSMASQRDLQRYRARSAHLTVEKLWD